MLERLKNLKNSKGQFKTITELSFAIDTDNTLCKEIEFLSKVFLKKTIGGCKNCYTDAYMELVNLNISKIMEQKQCQFEIRRGKLLYDVKGDISRLLSQANITDALAIYHLKTNPSCKKHFTFLPENWQEMADNFNIETGELENPDETKETIPGVEETFLIQEISELLKAGKSENFIRNKYKDIQEIDGVPLTVRRLNAMIKKAK